MAPATPRTARLMNDRSAYRLLLERGPLTRAQLRAATGLSRPTVVDLLDRLAADGLIDRLGEAGADRRGPNAALYGVVPDRAHVAGVAVDTRRIVASRADLTGRTVATAELPVDPDAEPAHQVRAALAATGEGTAVPLAAVTVGTPGLVDPGSGEVTFAAGMPGWRGGLRTGLHDALHVPVLVDNEVNLAGIAEHRSGAARGVDTFCLLSLDAGIGVAVLVGGRLHRGVSGGAGEIGYLPVLPGGRSLQHVLGASALAALAEPYRAGSGEDVHTPDGAPAEPNPRTAEITRGTAEITRGTAGSGPPGAVDAVLAALPDPGYLAELADAVAVAVTGVAAVLDPGTVVLGGPIGRAGGDRLAAEVANRVAAAIPLPTRVRAGTVAGDPALRGAVLTALDLLHDKLFPTG